MDIFATAEDYQTVTGREPDERTDDMLMYASAYIIGEGERTGVDIVTKRDESEAYAANLTRITCGVAALIADMTDSNDVSQESFTIGSFTSSQSFGSGYRNLLAKADRITLGLPKYVQKVSSVLVGVS